MIKPDELRISSSNDAPKEINQLIEEYWDSQLSTMEKSRASEKREKSTLRQYMLYSYTNYKKIPTKESDIRETVTDWIRTMKEKKGWSYDTIRMTKFSALNNFYNAIEDTPNPIPRLRDEYTSGRKSLSKGRGGVKKLYLDRDQLVEALDILKNKDHVKYENAFFAAKTGTRCGETFRVKKNNNLDIEKKRVTPQPVKGTNARQYAYEGIPFDSETQTMLRTALTNRKTLAPYRYYREYDDMHRAKESYNNWMNYTLKQIGNEYMDLYDGDASQKEKLTMHTLRRSLNKILRKNGWTGITRDVYMGWSDRLGTGDKRYDGFSIGDLREKYRDAIWKMEGN